MTDSDIGVLLQRCTRSAIHLEMRDGYADPLVEKWRHGWKAEYLQPHQGWIDLVAGVTSRGVRIRRARVVSEPVSELIRFEYDLTTAVNIASGEEVRWLPRRLATDIALPGNDFWLFDDTILLINHFTGDGEYTGSERLDDEALAQLCRSSFEQVWQRALPHANFNPA